MRRERVTFETIGPSRAHQSFKDECDIGNIMKRFEKSGLIEHVNRHDGKYGDYTNSPVSFHDAMNQVVAAQEMFMTLPAKIRKEFGNDPGAFLEAVEAHDGFLQ